MKKYTFPKIRRSVMLLLALLAFGQAAWAQGLSGMGTSDDPYLINDSIEWNWFAQSVTDGTTYANQFVSLNNDITVSTMAGIEGKCFSGTFDGQGHTITLDMTATMQFTALFCYADGATFRNLKVDGVLNTSKKFCAGLVGAVVYHGCTFTNCVSDVTINSTVQGDGTHGGFVSFLWRANTFEGCAFTGKLLGPSTTNVGGFVGFTETNQQGSVTFTNCLFIPEEVTMSDNGSQTFARWRSGDSAVTIGANCYYSQTLGDAQGKMMHSITGIKSANVAFYGSDTTYNVSGISAYSTGVKYAGIRYAGEGNIVSLFLTHDDHPGYTYGDGYTASAGTLTLIDGGYYTLAMPDEDVTIEPIISAYTVSVEANPNIDGAVEVSLDNDTWNNSVTAPVGNVMYFRINPPNGYAFDPYGLHIITEEGSPVNYTGNQFSMPASNVTVHAEFFNTGSETGVIFTVTLSPGDGGGNPIVYTFDPATAALNPAGANICQFYYVNYNKIGFRLPNDYCPDSFTAPEGNNFGGWFGGNNDGYITLTSTATTFTARWSVHYIDGNGEMHTCSNYTVLTGGVGETRLEAGWYVVNSDITYSNDNGKALIFKGDATIILCDSTTMMVTAHSYGISGHITLTIYGQSLDPNEAGTININNGVSNGITSVNVWTYIQHSGNVIAISKKSQAIYTSEGITVNGGSLQTSGKHRGIYAFGGDLTINGGTVTAFSTDTDGEYPGLYTKSNVIINGGKVETNGISATHNITLGYTHADDYILAGNYSDTVTVKSGQAFYYENEGANVIVSDTLNAEQINAIAGKTLRPYLAPITVTKDIAGYGNGNGGWHLIASPLLNPIDPATVGNLIADSTAHYDLYRFDQEKPLEWRNYKADSTFRLEACKGYLYANRDSVTLTFNGVPYFGNGKVTLTKTAGAQLEGWNLIGNPFSTAKTIGSKPFYRMNSLGTEIIAAENNIVEAMEGIFVVADTDGEVVTFTDVTRGNGQGNERIVLNLSGPSTDSDVSTGPTAAVIDRTIIRFGEGPTLPKSQINNNSTKIYIPQDGKDYAVVNANGTDEIPVNFKAEKNGVYTLTVTGTLASQFSVLRLFDSLTGTDVDLLATPTYTFTATTHDNASRFRLVFNTQSKSY